MSIFSKLFHKEKNNNPDVIKLAFGSNNVRGRVS